MLNLHRIFGCLALTVACGLAPGRAGAADEKSPNRYPFDPACAWGRLADGKGVVVRCLTEAEAAQLGAAKPNSPVVAPAASSAETKEKKNSTDVRAEPIDVDLTKVTADEGSLPIARRKLRVARDKYTRCVTDNGGLTTEVGEVTVRFLVRERGRAEGASVEKHRGVSEAAARCIAAVIDRRPVGTPEGPAVGATAAFRVTKQSKHRTESATGR